MSKTLQALTDRIGSLVNQGAEICNEYLPDLEGTGDCQMCGYTADVHLLRDAQIGLTAIEGALSWAFDRIDMLTTVTSDGRRVTRSWQQGMELVGLEQRIQEFRRLVKNA